MSGIGDMIVDQNIEANEVSKLLHKTLSQLNLPIPESELLGKWFVGIC